MSTEYRYGWAVTTCYRNKPERRFIWGKRCNTRSAAIDIAVNQWFSDQHIERLGRNKLWRRMKADGFRCERVILMTVEDYENALN